MAKISTCIKAINLFEVTLIIDIILGRNAGELGGNSMSTISITGNPEYFQMNYNEFQGKSFLVKRIINV